jgi:ribosomal protein L37AE/L43A
MSDRVEQIPLEWGAAAFCPHCDYALAGLGRGIFVCPECGGSLSAGAFAMTTVRRARGSLAARLVLLASPGAAFVGGVLAMLVRRAFYDALSVALVCMWVGGATAVYFSERKERRRFWRAVGIGLPVGVVYLVAVVLVAVGVVVLVGWLRG